MAQPKAEAMNKIRVMIVEDSAVVRQFLQQIIGSDSRLEVVAAVDSAEKALRLLEPLSPDVISMDVHLPGMNGFVATQQIMERKPTPIVVVSGQMESGDLKRSMEALRAGALAVVEKPVGNLHKDYQTLSEKLCTQLALMSQVNVIRQRFNGQRRTPPQPFPPASGNSVLHSDPDFPRRFSVLGLVASTGGPSALQKLLSSLGTDFPLPVVVVQHIMDSFHDGFVGWLNDTCPLPVCTAAHLQRPEPGHVYIAPVDRHLEVLDGILAVRAGEPVCRQRPSGTVLFQSMARSLGREALAVLMTGMGDDGAAGMLEIRDAGGYTIAEAESTAVVYGMPAAAVQRRAVCESLPLFDIGLRIGELVETTVSSNPPYPLAEKTA